MRLARTVCALLLILAFVNAAAASAPRRLDSDLRVKVRSHEEPEVDGSIAIELSIESRLDEPVDLVPELRLPAASSCFTGATLTMAAPSPAAIQPGQTQRGRYEVMYAPDRRPFSYSTLLVGLREPDSEALIAAERVYVYFTPYNTVEVWNEEDFDGLKRVWSSPSDAGAVRRAIPRTSIPASDLSDAELESPGVARRLASVSGLAYAVPRRVSTAAFARMDPNKPAWDRVAAMPAEGFPGFDAGAKKAPAARLEAGAGAAERGGGGGGGAKNRYTGHVTGSVFTMVDDDFGNPVSLNIVDIKVELLVKQTLTDDVIGTAFTIEGGVFDISFDTSLNDATIDVYLVVTAENRMGTIRVRKRLGGARSESHLKDSPQRFRPGQSLSWSPAPLNVDANDVKPQLLHWANRARQVVDSQITGFSLPTDPRDPLDIMRSFTGSGQAYTIPKVNVFGANLITLVASLLGVPGSAVAAIFLSSNDAIYVGSGRELDEDVIYHEFGHYLMWHMQDKSWLDPLKAGFATHFQDTNDADEELAWTEGFASGFGAIVDAMFQADDNELGLDGNATFEDRKVQDAVQGCVKRENVNWSIQCKAGSTPDCLVGNQALTHGFFSEWNIAAMIWDLWDGAGHPGGTSVPIVCDTVADAAALGTDFEDNGHDHVQLSLQEIVQPILDNPGGLLRGFVAQGPFLINNVMDYFTLLRDNPPASLSGLSSASAQRAIKDIFVWNGIKNLSDAVAGADLERRTLEADLPNTDLLGFTRVVTVDIFKPANSFDWKWKDLDPDPLEPGTFDVDITAFIQGTDDFNLANIGSPVMELSDDLLVTGMPNKGSGSLHFNHTNAFGWQSGANTFGQSQGVLMPLGTELEVHLAGGMKLEVRNGGKVALGESSEASTADVHLDSGGTFILGNGKLIVNSGSRFVVERGAKLVIDVGAAIELRGPTASLQIHGDLEIRADANFAYSGGGYVLFDLPDAAGESNATMLERSRMTFWENRFIIEQGTYVKPTEDATTSISLSYSTGEFGKESYFDVAKSTLLVNLSTIRSTGGMHHGIVVNGFPNLITGSTFSGGNPCIRAQRQGLVPLLVRDSELLASTYGILAENLPVGVWNSTFTLCVTSVHTTDTTFGLIDVEIQSSVTGVRSIRGGGSLVRTEIQNCGIGWYGTELEGNSRVEEGFMSYNTISGIQVQADGAASLSIELMKAVENGIGISVNGPVTLTGSCCYVSRNSLCGINLANGAILDARNGSGLELISNPVCIALEGAAMPLLDLGDNTIDPTAGGFTLHGTIDAVCSAGSSIPASRNTGSGGAPLGSSSYSVKDATKSCSFLIQGTTLALPTSCP